MPRILATLVLVLAAMQAALAAPAAEAVLSHEIVPATAEAKRNGEAAFIPLKDGSLLLLYGAHSKPGDWDRGEIRQIRSRDGGKTWSQPETVFSDPERSLFQCALDRLPSGDLGLTHTSLAHGQDAIKVFRRSSDEGKTWSEPIVISDKEYAYTTGPWDKLYVLESGRLIAILHCNLKPDAKKQGGPLGSYTVSSDDDGKTWKRSPASDVLHVADNPHKGPEWGFWEPSLVEHAPGKLLMLGRTTTGWLWESRSVDNGTTWSAPVKTAVPNPVAPPVLTRVPGTDTLVLIQNPDVDMKSGWHGGPRRALAFRTSTDGGRTWSEPTDLYRATEEGLWVDYPAIRWIDGNLHLVWRHIRGGGPGAGGSMTGLFHHVVPAAAFTTARGADAAARQAGREADLVVIGGTPGGIACAVRAAREGLSVVLVNRHDHLGGIMSSGLGAWDTQYEGRRSPLYDEMRQAFFDFYRRTYGEDSPQYRDALPGKTGHNNGRFEPHVAERLFTELVEREKNITVLRGFVPVGVERDAAAVKAVTIRPMRGGGDTVLRGKVFADATYEGDLAALAKVPYRVGRESRDEFGEPHAGIVFMKPVSQPPDAESARLAELRSAMNLREFTGWQIRLPASTGAADPAVQACNYRTPLVTGPANRVPITKPENYDPYYLKTLEVYSGVASIPNGKFSWNRPQLLGLQTPYVEADWTERQRIMDRHWETTLALLYFHQHDPTVPEKVRAAWLEYGLAKDEFVDNGHRPYEMYVREARRITARAMFTQHDAMLAPGLGRAPVHGDSIAVTEWYMDAHGCTTARVPGSMDEGKAMLHQETFPGQLPWRCLLPQGVDNLIVPVCLGATHVAWGSVRLEPVFMQTGEAAGLAAAIAVKGGQPPAGLDADRLVRELCRRKFMLSFFNDIDVGADDPRVAAAQYFGTKGFFADYDARLDAPLETATQAVWERGLAALRAGTLDPANLVKQVHQAEAKDSPPTTRTRGAALLTMWQSL
jgi:predicted neuraminidase